MNDYMYVALICAIVAIMIVLGGWSHRNTKKIKYKFDFVVSLML